MERKYISVVAVSIKERGRWRGPGEDAEEGTATGRDDEGGRARGGVGDEGDRGEFFVHLGDLAGLKDLVGVVRATKAVGAIGSEESDGGSVGREGKVNDRL